MKRRIHHIFSTNLWKLKHLYWTFTPGWWLGVLRARHLRDGLLPQEGLPDTEDARCRPRKVSGILQEADADQSCLWVNVRNTCNTKEILKIEVGPRSLEEPWLSSRSQVMPTSSLSNARVHISQIYLSLSLNLASNWAWCTSLIF